MKKIKVIKIGKLMILLNKNSNKEYFLNKIMSSYHSEVEDEDAKSKVFITIYNNIKYIKIINWTFGTDWFVTTNDNIERKLWDINVNSEDNTLERIGNSCLSSSLTILNNEYIVLDFALKTWLKQFNLDVDIISESMDITGTFQDEIILSEEELLYLKALLKNDKTPNLLLLAKVEDCMNKIDYR